MSSKCKIGISNNIVHSMRSPKFTEALFHLDTQVREVSIHVHY